jgi:hypothetical protein
MKTVLRTLTGPFVDAQTFRNLACLVGNIIFGFAYYLTLQIGLALAWGLTGPLFSILPNLDLASQIKTASVILGGLLILPILVWILQLFVLPEQWMMNHLLNVNLPLDTAMWTKDSILLRPIRLLAAISTWKHVFHALIKIPLGVISFAVLFLALLPALALLAMPLAYLAGFQNLVVGVWRLNTLGNAALAFLVGLLLLPISLHTVRLLANISGWLAKALLVNEQG